MTASTADTKSKIKLTRTTLLLGLSAAITSIPIFIAMLILWPFLFLRKRQVHASLLRMFLRITIALSPIRIRTEGLANLQNRSLLVSNRQSLFDMFVLATLPTAPRFIIPSKIMFIPIIGWLFALAGFIPLRGSNRASASKALDDASKLLGDGASIAVFPEGKQGESGTVSRFLSQPFRLAQPDVPVVPVCITGGWEICKGSSFPSRPGTFSISLQDPLPSQLNEKQLAKKAFDSINAGMPEIFRAEGWTPEV